MDDLGRPTWCDVDLGAIASNVAAIQAHVGGVEVMPVIKANAYGHGAVEVARRLEQGGTRRVGVAYVEEAIELRRAGVGVEIHVLGGAVERQVPLFFEHDLIFTVPSVDKLHQIEAEASRRSHVARVHLKLDTGMERIGVHHANAGPFIEAAVASEWIDVDGVFSHLANSDVSDPSSAEAQLERLLIATEHFARLGVPMPTRHLANSGAVAQLPETWLDLVRPGILIYGVWPSAETKRTIDLTPAMSWRSEVVYFKVVTAGRPVGYGSTWTPDTDVRVVTIPVGYGDGYPRAASNRAEVLIRGARRQVVGNVCMDQTMVNIDWGTAYNGDVVTLVGADDDARVTVEELAGWADTIPYEVLTTITARVPRRYPSS